jgi:YggT family protein
MSGNLGNAAWFLIHSIFGICILVVMLRFLLQLVGADPFNPLSKMVLALSNPVLNPVRNIVPRWRNFDLASMGLVFILQCSERGLFSFFFQQQWSIVAIPIRAIASLLELGLFIFIISIFAQVILSWVAPGRHNSMTNVMNRINEPLLGRARRLIPPVAGIDLSPLVVLIGLQLVISYLLVPELLALASAI